MLHRARTARLWDSRCSPCQRLQQASASGLLSFAKPFAELSWLLVETLDLHIGTEAVRNANDMQELLHTGTEYEHDLFALAFFVRASHASHYIDVCPFIGDQSWTCPCYSGQGSIALDDYGQLTTALTDGSNSCTFWNAGLQGYGRLLMEEAERIACLEHRSHKMAVISGVGTRHYYRKMGYQLEGPYMVKNLRAKLQK